MLAGRVLVSQKQYDKALAKFDDVLAMEGSEKEAERQKQAAMLGRASALAGADKADEAIKLVEDFIAKNDAENAELFARAYIVLGNCHKAAGKKKEAVMDFLHVDLLYPRFADLHAEALGNLAMLFGEIDKPDSEAQSLARAQGKISQQHLGAEVETPPASYARGWNCLCTALSRAGSTCV